MAERNERPIFEGRNRRTENRRIAERRKFERVFTILKYLVVILFVAAFIKIFSQ